MKHSYYDFPQILLSFRICLESVNLLKLVVHPYQVYVIPVIGDVF